MSPFSRLFSPVTSLLSHTLSQSPVSLLLSPVWLMFPVFLTSPVIPRAHVSCFTSTVSRFLSPFTRLLSLVSCLTSPVTCLLSHVSCHTSPVLCLSHISNFSHIS